MMVMVGEKVRPPRGSEASLPDEPPGPTRACGRALSLCAPCQTRRSNVFPIGIRLYAVRRVDWTAVVEKRLLPSLPSRMPDIVRPHEPHRQIPPESSQNRAPVFAAGLLFLTRSRAASTVP